MAIALNHENLSDKEVSMIIKNYEKQLQLPTTDVLTHGCRKLIQTLVDHFPELNQKLIAETIENIPVLERTTA
jgi:hypothetical protein